MSKATVLVRLQTGKTIDVEVPTDVEADTLIHALHQALKMPGSCPDYIRCDNPVAFLQGQASVSMFGVREGTILYM